LRGHQPFEELLEFELDELLEFELDELLEFELDELLEFELDELFELELEELLELELDEPFELELEELLPANCSNFSSVACAIPGSVGAVCWVRRMLLIPPVSVTEACEATVAPVTAATARASTALILGTLFMDL
jgi:hypothetical protein